MYTLRPDILKFRDLMNNNNIPSELQLDQYFLIIYNYPITTNVSSNPAQARCTRYNIM